MESNSSQNKNETNTLRSEHLTNGELPIVACVEGYHDLPIGDIDSDTIENLILEKKYDENAEYAEYRGNAREKI